MAQPAKPSQPKTASVAKSTAPAQAPTSAAAAATAAAKSPAPAQAAAAPTSAARKTPVSAGERSKLIAETAYFIAQKRGFAPGNQLQDWLNAEQQVDRSLGKRP